MNRCRRVPRALPAGLAAAAVLAVLAGCAAPTATSTLPHAPAYSAPTSGQRARLVLSIKHNDGQSTLSTYEQPISCSHRREMTTTATAEPPVAGRDIAARLQTVGFLHQRRDRRVCEVIVSFEAQPGRAYVMRSEANAQQCTVLIVDATNVDNPQQVPMLHRERIGYGLQDNACKPITSTSIPKRSGTGSSAPMTLDDFKELLPRP